MKQTCCPRIGLTTAGAIFLIGTAGMTVAAAAEPATGSSGPPAFTGPLSGRLPYDVNVSLVRDHLKQGNIAAAHAQFDTLAWQAFIALNWPAEPDGSPSKSRTIAETSAPRVWDFWRSSDTIFLPQGCPPDPWNGQAQRSSRFYWKAAWRQHTTAASNLEAFSGPLVDQNGHWVRYQIRVNREEFNYILKNGLYSLDKQVEFSQRDHDNQVSLPSNVGETTHGAIEIKLAWKELGPGDDESRFYTREITAELSEPPDPRTGKPVPPRTFEAGLVGMHIAMHTQSAPEWIWATFEQIDNVRVNQYPDGRPVHPNFFNPRTPSATPNVLPTANAIQNPDTGALQVATDPAHHPDKWVESLTRTPVQLQRIPVPVQRGLNPLDATLAEVTRAINRQVQQLLAANHSVFEYYELIDTQWPMHPNAPAAAGGAGSAPESITHKTPGDMVPVFLVNTTMETYFQKGKQEAGPLEQDDRLASGSIDSTIVSGTESCVGCHYSSGIAIAFKKDLETGAEILDKHGVPTPVFGENNHFGKTGNASFSWMLQLEPSARPRGTGAACKKPTEQ